MCFSSRGTRSSTDTPVCRERKSRSIYRVMPSALVCPDKFKGTLSAADAAAALVAARGGSRRHTTVTGPLGEPVDAEWALLRGGVAVVEMAQASGLTLMPR